MDLTLPIHLPTTSLGAAESALLVLFLAGVTVVTLLGMAFWVLWLLLKGTAAIMSRLANWPMAGRSSQSLTARAACPDPVCRAINSTAASFCRQCGRMLRDTHR